MKGSIIHIEKKDDRIILDGKIDSFSAPYAEKMLAELCHDQQNVILDCSDLVYTASSGLRILLSLARRCSLTLTGVRPEVYEVLEAAGFTALMNVEKEYRTISVDGCEVIGEGAEGIVYRLNPETVVKVYKKKDVLPDIERERELARTALILGVPTAIAYDIVKLSDGRYGAVYELVEAKSYAKLLKSGEKTVEEIADLSVKLLKVIHAARDEEGKLPSMKQIALERTEQIRPHLNESDYRRLRTFIHSLDDSRCLLHGDFHIKNIHYLNGESILIDMITLCTGDPVFELAGIYYTNRSFADLDPDNAVKFLGITQAQAFGLCDQIIGKYCSENPEKFDAAMDRIQLIAYCRLLRFTGKSKHYDPLFKEKQIRHAREKIHEYLDRLGIEQEKSL